MQEHLLHMRQATRVIPLEPTLKLRRNILLFGTMLVVSYVVTFVFFRPANQAIFGPGSFFYLFWAYFLIRCIVAFKQGKPWRTLEQKRQRAARSHLTKGEFITSVFQHDLHVPASFTIQLRHRWRTIAVFAMIEGVFLLLAMLFLYWFWQDTLSLVILQQESIGLALLQTVLNVFVMLAGIVGDLDLFFFMPRQQLSATQDGLFCRRGYHFSSIPWKHARLFALIGEEEAKKQGNVYYYEVSSEDAVIRWSSLPIAGSSWKTPSATVGVTARVAQPEASEKEYQQDVQTLVWIVALRTGLPLYDLR
jgi:hypothetical protein